MQVFLKKVFRKDIIAIIRNITGAIIHWLQFHVFNNIAAWLQKATIQFKVWREQLNDQYKKKMIGDRLQVPTIIYQPGKVGSITVYQSLKTALNKQGISTPVYHAHNLDRIEAIEEFVKQARKAPENTLKKLDESKALRREIDGDPSQKWNIISLVRDPVALRVSTMFQILDEYIPDWPKQVEENKLSIEDLQHILLTEKELNPAFLAAWFSNQVKGLFGFDIFSSPFDVEQGYKIYRPFRSRFSFMIIRLEDLNRVAPRAFYDFIRLENFQVINYNIGEQKPYSELYKRFKTTPLPAEYLDAAYKTQYARHFYSPKELEAFQKRWLGKA